MARLTLDWIQLASVVGALQGLLLVVVLLAHRANRTANRLLAALMLAITLYLASSVYFATGLVEVHPHFFGLSYSTLWLFGPLVYLYAVAASDRSWRFERRHLLHFLPAALITLAVSPYYMMSGAEKIAFYHRLLTGDVPARMAIIEPTKFPSGIAYSVLTALYLRRHRRRIEDSYSNTARRNLSWLGWLAGAAAGIWLIATVLEITDFGQRLREEHVTLAIALLAYAIGYMGLRHPEVFRYETQEFAVVTPAVSQAVSAAESSPVTPVEPDAPVARYERSGLRDSEAERLRTSLLAVMDDERPWKDSELTLPDLAALLNSTPHKLSEVLNDQVGQTFYDFVNGYRVREVQRRIRAGDAQRLKVLALALDAGFASKSTFNAAFKKHTSQTPSEFREAVGG
jgi:AraC-like DNA-binding protein